MPPKKADLKKAKKIAAMLKKANSYKPLDQFAAQAAVVKARNSGKGMPKLWRRAGRRR